MARNVCRAVDKPKRRQKPMRIWTAEQARMFLKGAEGNRYYPVYVLAITSGMRLGELLGLKWGDLDLLTGTVAVQHNLIMTEGNKYELAEPKTAAGRG